MMPALAGGLMGGLLGQAGDALSAPRRALMGAVGLPEQGSELLHQLLGVDPNGMAGQLGGFATEVATDPLSYAGFLGGSLAPLFGGPDKVERLAEAQKLQAAAQAAAGANEAGGMSLGSEILKRLGREAGPADAAAAGPRTGVYNRALDSASRAGEAGSTVSADVRAAKGNPADYGGSPRKANAAARSDVMAANATGNDDMMAKALGAYADPYEGQTMALPGMMLSPQNASLRGNPLAMMNPQDAMQGIDPLVASLMGQQKRPGMSPLEIAMMGGTLGGSVGAGMMGGQGR